MKWQQLIIIQNPSIFRTDRASPYQRYATSSPDSFSSDDSAKVCGKREEARESSGQKISSFFTKEKKVHSTLVDHGNHCSVMSVCKLKPTQGVIMPYVNIRVAGTLTKEQKQKISKGVTEVISKEANKPPEAILIFIDEVPHENIAKAGKLMEPPK
jgi:4-oxalocrotonate tautomerase